MPGFSQLKKFSEDILSLGDESTLRATRGERLVRFEIPNTIEDKDDSEDFVLGMPEIVAEVVDTQIDDDLSDIMGISSSDSSTEDSSAENAGPSFEAPDMSNLLNPIGIDENTFTTTSLTPDTLITINGKNYYVMGVNTIVEVEVI